MISSLNVIGISNDKQLKKFYSKWSINASKLIQQYAKDHSIEWFNTKWRNKSKDIPFYIRTKAPKGFLGNVWFASAPTNYASAKSAPKFKVTRKAFSKKTKIKPVRDSNGKWFTPKKYKPDIYNIDASLLDEYGKDALRNGARFFVSKTSHNGTHKYKRPMLWYQISKYGKPDFATLDKRLSDYIADDPETYDLIQKAFEQTVSEFTSR